MNTYPKSDCTYVYVAEIPEGELKELYPRERQSEIDLIKNEKLKREKYYVWRLLEYALAESFGKDITELEFTKHESGRWSTPFCEFSLSHTDGVVAVAVSNESVGVDVEIVKTRHNDKTAKRVMSAEEYNKYQKLSESERAEFFFCVWTGKEAVFKSLHQDSFVPSFDYHDSGIAVKTKKLFVKDAKVIVSVATEDKNVEFFDVRTLA